MLVNRWGERGREHRLLMGRSRSCSGVGLEWSMQNVSWDTEAKLLTAEEEKRLLPGRYILDLRLSDNREIAKKLVDIAMTEGA